MSTTPHLSELRQHLMGTLDALRDRNNPMEPDRARAVAQVAGVMVDTARVEIDYLKVTKQARAGFLDEQHPSALAHTPTAHNPFPAAPGILGVRRHTLGDEEPEAA